MTRILTIALHEFSVNVRRPAFIFFTLLVPGLGLIGLVTMTFFSGQASRFITSQFAHGAQRAGVVDEAHLFTPIRPEFADRFDAFPDEATARRALVAGEIGAVVVIPADYVDTGRVTSYTRDGFSNVTSVDTASLRAFLVDGLLAGKVDPALVERASYPADVELVTVDAQGKPTTNEPYSFVAGFIIPYFLSLFLVMSIFISSGYLLRSVSEEKENRVIEIILSSVSASQLLAGKVLGLGALGLTQVAVWLVSAFALSGGLGIGAAGSVFALNPAMLVLALAYFVLGYLVFGIIMATAGALGSNMRESQQLAGIFSFLAAGPYMLGGLVVANPNALLARALSFFPLTAPTMMMLRLPLGSVPSEDIVGSLIVLVVTVPVVLWAGAKIFRIGLLMYGKRPSASEILRVLRSA